MISHFMLKVLYFTQLHSSKYLKFLKSNIFFNHKLFVLPMTLKENLLLNNFILGLLCFLKCMNIIHVNAAVPNEDNTELIKTNNLFVPNARTEYYGKKSIKFLGPTTWNEFPVSI